MYQPTAAEVQTRNKTNNVLYPKAAQLPNGRLVAAFERSFGNPVGQTLPIYKSDDYGTSWQALDPLEAPAQATAGTPRAAEFAKYTSNWTNPYLYTLPTDVGELKAGTLLLASLVSGQDELWAERKAADPSWQPQRDGDRRDLAIALYASVDGESWDFLNIIAEGGWSGSYGDASAISDANTFKQVDPVWEPYLMAYNGELITYYTSEIDYTGFDPATGELQRDPDWETAPDTVNQTLAHTVWDGRAGNEWSAPVADVVGGTTIDSTGTPILGQGRPGMTNVVPTTDGKWILTAEFGVTKISDDPLRFWDKPQVDLAGSGLNPSGSPVHIVIPDPSDPNKWRLAFNSAATGGEIYVNESGRSDGQWLRYRTPLGNGYSRNLTYVPQTGRVVILRATFGVTSDIQFGEVDLGDSVGSYYALQNARTGAVLGTGGSSQDVDVTRTLLRNEAATEGEVSSTQLWHVVPKGGGGVTFLNRSGGRALGIFENNSQPNGRLAQWTDDGGADKVWTLVANADGSVKVRSTANSALFLTGGAEGTEASIQNATSDGSQDWRLVEMPPSSGDLTPTSNSDGLIEVAAAQAGKEVSLDAAEFLPNGAARNADVEGTVYVLRDGAEPQDIGRVSFGEDQVGSVSLPPTSDVGDVRIAVQFDTAPLVWDELTVEAADAGSTPGGGGNPPGNGGPTIPGTIPESSGGSPAGGRTSDAALASTGVDGQFTGALLGVGSLLAAAGAVILRRRRKTQTDIN